MKSHKTTMIFFTCFSIVLLLLAGSRCLAAEMPAADALAIKGYDTVAYFISGKALKGSASFTAQWHGMTWYFSTPANRELFAADPEKYAPQYDGYCAWAMTEARKALTDPQVWKIVDGRLYLNCSQAAYDKWSKDIPGHIQKADANWLKLQGRN